MIHLIAFLSGAVGCAVFYFVLRYRVHLHVIVTYTRAPSRPSRSHTRAGSMAHYRRGEWSPAPSQGDHEDGAGIPGGAAAAAHPRVTPLYNSGGAKPAPDRPAVASDDRTADIFSALRNLQVKAKPAGAIAAAVVAEFPDASFDDQLRAALQRARECAA